jgi:hypothetical protein
VLVVYGVGEPVLAARVCGSPVKSTERLGLHEAVVAYAWENRTPAAARPSRCGVFTTVLP